MSRADVERALHALHDAHGGLTPEVVLNAARAPESVLHEHFTWDDSVAAEAWRKEQARTLIRSVRIKVVEIPGANIPAFVSVRREEERPRYERTDHVMADPMKRERFLRQAEMELQAWKRRYEGLKEYAEIVRRVLDPKAA